MARLNFDLDPPALTAAAIAEDRRRWRHAIMWSTLFVALLWVILVVQLATGLNPGQFGVRPHLTAGLLGVLTAPLFHSDIAHLVANTSVLLVLGTIAVRLYPRALRIALPVIWLGSGLLVWFAARPASHIGASGVAQGLMFFIFAMGLLRRERIAIMASMLVFFLYGGMVYGVLPQDPGISYEAHLFGSLCGLLCGIALSRLDPLPPRKTYSWDEEEDEEEEDFFEAGSAVDDFDDEPWDELEDGVIRPVDDDGADWY